MRGIAVAVPWSSKLPAPSDPLWKAFGRAVCDCALAADSGKEAFDECLIVRKQLEFIVRSSGFPDATVAIFGGVVVNRFLESGGDIDFVAVCDYEPSFEQSSDAVAKLGREMRRVGLRANSLPRARVPVVKVDRVSTALPGTPLHSMSRTAVFQLLRPAKPDELAAFDELARLTYGAESIEWNHAQQLATVTFPSSMHAVSAIASLRRSGDIDVPLRLPIDPKLGPELYRFPFDLCMQSSGLQNSHLICNSLAMWDYSRHLLLFAKRWGRSTGIVDSFNGMLASYAVTVLVMHFLVRYGKLDPLDVNSATEPQLLPAAPEYLPLRPAEGGDVAELGYLVAAFFEYFSSVFDYETDVAATTTRILAKETLRWTSKGREGTTRPPHHYLAIKDPFNTENIGRNLDRAAAEYVRDSFRLGLERLLAELRDPGYAAELLLTSPPRPGERSAGSSTNSSDDVHGETRRELKKLEFSSRKATLQRIGEATVKRNTQAKAAQDLTRSIIKWIRGPTSSPKASPAA